MNKLSNIFILIFPIIFINIYNLEFQGSLDNQELKLRSIDDTTILNKCNNKSFNDFWSKFRKATLNKDTLILNEMVCFPLQVKLWHYDENSKFEIVKADFIEYYNEFLSQRSGLNRTNLHETMIEYINRTPNILVEHLNKHDTLCIQKEARIGAMIFKYEKEWMLNGLYFNPKTIEKTIDK
ncbi:MAG: hypothetical protein ACQETL_19005 [Bacteroidota bacterium]